MPPSSPAAGSGVWFTAQRTIRNSAIIGIFSIRTSQMKVHALTSQIVYPACDPYNPRRGSPLCNAMRDRRTYTAV